MPINDFLYRNPTSHVNSSQNFQCYIRLSVRKQWQRSVICISRNKEEKDGVKEMNKSRRKNSQRN